MAVLDAKSRIVYRRVIDRAAKRQKSRAAKGPAVHMPVPKLKKRSELTDEPQPDLQDDDWVEWGGELIWEMDTTSGGAPIGIGVDEFREMNEQAEYAAPWARAKRAFGLAFASPGIEVGIDYVTGQGRGHSREGFAADVSPYPDPRKLRARYVALVARRDADAEYVVRVRREAGVLDWVSTRIRGLRVSWPVALIADVCAPILVESFVPGLAVDLRMGRMLVKPWEVVAQAAAAIHGVEAPPADVVPTRDRGQHRAEMFSGLFDGRDIEPGLITDAYAWLREHLDRPGPGVLLHGDLLGHNLRWFPDAELGVIDWEQAEVGDPAYDLAIVTRGVRRPFQCVDGRDQLLANYAMRSGHEVTGADLRFFEIALHVRWARADPEHTEYLDRLPGLLRGA